MLNFNRSYIKRMDDFLLITLYKRSCFSYRVFYLGSKYIKKLN